MANSKNYFANYFGIRQTSTANNPSFSEYIRPFFFKIIVIAVTVQRLYVENDALHLVVLWRHDVLP